MRLTTLNQPGRQISHFKPPQKQAVRFSGDLWTVMASPEVAATARAVCTLFLYRFFKNIKKTNRYQLQFPWRSKRDVAKSRIIQKYKRNVTVIASSGQNEDALGNCFARELIKKLNKHRTLGNSVDWFESTGYRIGDNRAPVRLMPVVSKHRRALKKWEKTAAKDRYVTLIYQKSLNNSEFRASNSSPLQIKDELLETFSKKYNIPKKNIRIKTTKAMSKLFKKLTRKSNKKKSHLFYISSHCTAHKVKGSAPDVEGSMDVDICGKDDAYFVKRLNKLAKKSKGVVAIINACRSGAVIGDSSKNARLTKIKKEK